MLSDVQVWGVSKSSGYPNWICAITRHHLEPNIYILLTRNLPFDFDVRELTITLHCWWANFNNKTCDQFEFSVTWFCFYFDFVRSHARCCCCFTVSLRFQVVR